MLRLQAPLPERYTDADARRARDADRARPRPPSATALFILGHHYQRDEVMRWADARGDSFRLSVLAQERPEAEYIVFCGVHFMAESADILTGDHQQVILPDLNAGCSMADMADLDEVEEAWEALGRRHRHRRGSCPITYMNSSAALKAFVGRHGGAVCTSTNARAVLEWAFRPRVPRAAPAATRCCSSPTSTSAATPASRWATPHDDMRVWNPRLELGGLTEADVQGGHLPALEGPLLGPPALPARARRRLPGRAPRRHRGRPPRVRPRGVRARRPGRLDRLHHQGGRGRSRRARSSPSAPRSTW